MRKFIKETGLYTSLIASYLTMKEYTNKNELINFKEEMTARIKSLQTDLVSEQINNEVFKTKIETKLLELQNGTNKVGNVFSDLFQEKDVNSEAFKQLRAKALQEFEKVRIAVEELNESFGENSKNLNFDGFDQYISTFQNYLNTLTLEQAFSLAHMFAFLALFICLFNLASVFYGESLIKYYKLEIKFPKLSKFIKIRSMFQQYYFGWNLFLILTILAGLFYFNLKVFLL